MRTVRTTPNACRTTCDLAYCGDGVIQEDFEDCDDGNNQGGDGCSAKCQVEPGWVCDGSRLVQDTGFAPRWDAAAGLADVLAFYRKENWL